MTPHPDPLVLSAFTMSTVSHGNTGLWRHPDDRTSDYTKLRYWLDLARGLDAGGFDLLFIADAVGQLDVYGGSAREALARGVQTPVTDPLLAVSAMAAATEHLGFGVTVSTTYEQPYLLARKLSTLDHLTDGRIGWNIVTSLLDSAARNILARDRQIGHDERYEMAQEFMDVAYELWEGSWEAPQRTPLLLQAGTSPVGREFAARNAELVFIADPRPEILRGYVDDIRRRAAAHGRGPHTIRFITSVTVVVDATDRAAEAKARDLRRFRDTRGGLVLLSALSGVDWSEHDLDRPIEEFDTDASRSVLASVSDPDVRDRLTLRDYVDGLSGFGGEVLVGGAATVADALERYAERSGVDGFNFVYLITPGSFDDLAEHLIPELRRRGRVAEPGATGTIRDRIFGAGAQLPHDHPARAGPAGMRRTSGRVY